MKPKYCDILPEIKVPDDSGKVVALLYLQAFSQARTTEWFRRGSISLVKARLEHKLQPKSILKKR